MSFENVKMLKVFCDGFTFRAKKLSIALSIKIIMPMECLFVKLQI